MAETRKFHAIFCDDIRHEINGKTSLIGCYTGQMYVPVFPVTLPRICIHTYLSTPIEKPFKGGVSISVMKDGDILTRNDIDGDQAVETIRQHLGLSDDSQRFILIGGLEFAPLALDGPCLLQVVAEVDGEALIGERLKVDLMPATPQA